MKTAPLNIERFKEKEEKTFLEAYIELCNKHQLSFAVDEEGILSLAHDDWPVEEGLLSLKSYAEFQLDENYDKEKLFRKLTTSQEE